jgi:uncharacterized membrane protein
VVGLTEAQAKANGLSVRVGSTQIPASDRGWIHKAGNARLPNSVDTYPPDLGSYRPKRWRRQQVPWSATDRGPVGQRRILDSRTDRSTGSEMAYNDVIEKIGMTIDAAGVVVIVAGAAIAFVACTVGLSRREGNVYRRFRQRLGQTILLGLELFVAGDIVRTVAASPSLTSVAILASIVLIRTFLSFSLEVEISGRWPWQKHDIAAS